MKEKLVGVFKPHLCFQTSFSTKSRDKTSEVSRLFSNCASVKKEYNETIFPSLIKILTTCRSQSFAQYAESVFVAVNPQNKEKYIKILQKRKDLLSNAGKKRIEKILRKIQD